MGAVTLEELRKHDSLSSLWVAIDGKVYDLTSWTDKHPGGRLTLMNVAGRDATVEFTAFHPIKVRGMLSKFYVGDLEDAKLSPCLEDFCALRATLEKEGLFETDYTFYMKQGVTLICILSLIIYTIVYSKSFPLRLLCAIPLGIVWNMCSFIGHDTGHSGITHNLKIDSMVGLIMGNLMTGIGIGWWKKSHNVHHLMCNSLDYDPDIQHVPLVVVSTNYFRSLYSYYKFQHMEFGWIARSLVSYQHIYFYPLMAVARVNLYAQSLLHLFSSDTGFIDKGPLRSLELISLTLFYVWFSALVSVFPTWWQSALFFLLCMATSGILHVQIIMSHLGMPTFVGRPEEQSFVATQLAGTLDVACPTWLDWFWGGLQFQIEHHLFPRMPRHNLRKVMGRVQEFAKKHDLPYSRVSWLEANKRVVNALYTAAIAARQLKNPEVTFKMSYLWEGLNAWG